MKGAEETLHQKSGNDCDQATLLVALLRASGYPSRYVRGTIEFFPDIQTAKNLTGIDDPQKNAEFFQKAGIPFKTVLDGTTIRNIQIERMWVETFVPYANYRGAIMDDQGKTWLGLDTSIKASGYTYNTASDIMSEYTLSTVRDDYLNAIRTETPLEYLRTRISDYLVQSHPTKTYNDYLSTRTLVPEVMQILPSGLQFKETAITNEYTAVPAELIHTVTLSAKAPDSTALFTISFDAYKLSNRKVIIHFEPETVEDQEIIDSFGGLSFTPAYLVHLRPTLMIDDQRIVIGNNGIAMGGDFELVVTASSPNSAETFTNSMISGNTIALGIVSQKATLPAGEDEQDAADLLSREAIRYIDNWNKAEDELASLLRVSTARPIPSIITLGNTIDVTYVLDQPHGFAWKGLFLDADLRAVESVQSSGSGVQSERQKLFMQLSGLQGSVLEGKLFEDAFNVTSISTAKLFGSANSSQPAVPIISIDKANIATVLSTISCDQNIKDDILDAVNNQDLIVRIPQSEMIYQDWTGIGYIKENSATGEAGYMLSGMVAGGMTALGVLKWPEPWDSILQGYEPLYTGPTNTNPSASYSMEKVSGTDYQAGQVVNTETTQPLAVVVKDISGKPVKNASVTFTIKAGGGSLKNAQTGQLVSSLTTTTDPSGRAKANLKLGKLTSTNPSYVQRAWETYPWQVGENIVDGTLGSGPNSGTSLTEPFTIVAFPDAAAKMNVTGSGGYANVLSYIGTLSTFVTDTHGNPVSNATVTYDAQLPQRTPPCGDAGNAKRAQLIIDQTCADNLASWGECPNAVYTVTAKTYVDGSLNVGVVLGDWPSATYPISISSTIAGVQTTNTANLFTRTFGNCDPENPPQDVLNLEYFHQIDAQGHNIEARPANIPSPIWAKAYVLTQVDGLPTVTYPPEMTVMFTATNTLTSVATAYTGTHQGNGKYQAAVTLAAAPYDIKVDAAYSTTSPKTKTGRVYGVDIQTPAYLVMPIDQNGTAIQDVPLTYTIGPSTYLAATAQIAVYKNDVLVAVMQTEKQGAGFGTIARGFNFDKNSFYYYRVVLNYAYNSEIWSGGVPLVVSSVEVLDNSSPVRELKFGDGHNAKKKYHVGLISNDLVSACPSLNGTSTIKVVNSSGNGITATAGGYSPTSYNLQFTLQGNSCSVSVQDGASNKSEFVISNLTTTALVSRNTLSTDTTAVLYGGIGNKLELNIGGTKKYIPIEPVGVIVLGIDGLRQDVLYLSSEASYTDSNGCGQNTSCNVPINGTTLPGLSQILQETGMVKLKDVTAIFPSITFASWASIFTGMTPSQTGITGNEFFARDLYDPNTPYNEDIPGLEAFPSGMVTLDADGGAFLPGLTFAFLHAIPAEFINSIFTPATLSEKLESSAPVDLWGRCC